MAGSSPHAEDGRGKRADYRPVGTDPNPSALAMLKRTFKEFSQDNLTDWAAALSVLRAPRVVPLSDRASVHRRARRRPRIPDRAHRVRAGPGPLAPPHPDRPSEARRVDQLHRPPPMTGHDHTAAGATHDRRRGLDRHEQPLASRDLNTLDSDHVQAGQPDQQITVHAVGGGSPSSRGGTGAGRTAARGSAPRRLGHRRGLPDGQLGRYRSWKVATRLRRQLDRVSLTPSSGTKSRFTRAYRRDITGRIRQRQQASPAISPAHGQNQAPTRSDWQNGP
jgi:hypothetical protein